MTYIRTFEFEQLRVDTVDRIAEGTGRTREALLEELFSLGEHDVLYISWLNPEWWSKYLDQIPRVLNELNMTPEEFVAKLEAEMRDIHRHKVEGLQAALVNVRDYDVKLPKLLEGVTFPTRVNNTQYNETYHPPKENPC